MTGERAPDDPLAVLRRWEAGGGIWAVRARTGEAVEFALLSCDAGEEMGRLRSADPAVLAHVGRRTRSDDPDGPDDPDPDDSDDDGPAGPADGPDGPRADG